MNVLLVEDRPSMSETLATALNRAGGVSVLWAPHFGFSEAAQRRDRRPPAVLLADVDLVLLDAYDHDQIQDDPTRSAFGCLNIFRHVRSIRRDARPRLIAYSTSMAEPEVDVALHCTGLVDARYTPQSLLDELPSILQGANRGARPDPAPADWKRIHPELRRGADLASLHEMMESNPRAWRQVWDPSAPFDQAAQQWIRRQILPWLSDADHPGYRLAIDITRRLARLPSASTS